MYSRRGDTALRHFAFSTFALVPEKIVLESGKVQKSPRFGESENANEEPSLIFRFYEK